ncbi:MAG: YceD family protein [Dongiaceae bacterium]
MDKAATQPEFSRLISAEQIGVQETTREIAANAAERDRLAERLGLLSLDRLAATLRLQRLRSGIVRVRGRLEAEVVQSCVVSLEPVPARLVEEFAVSFTMAAEDDGGGEIVVAVEDEDPAEKMQSGRIDLGETVVQQLAVALDPYPRSRTAVLAYRPDGESAAGKRPGPFAALDELRRRRDE